MYAHKQDVCFRWTLFSIIGAHLKPVLCLSYIFSLISTFYMQNTNWFLYRVWLYFSDLERLHDWKVKQCSKGPTTHSNLHWSLFVHSIFIIFYGLTAWPVEFDDGNKTESLRINMLCSCQTSNPRCLISKEGKVCLYVCVYI